MSHEDFDVQSREYAVLRSQVGRSVRAHPRGQITLLYVGVLVSCQILQGYILDSIVACCMG